MDESRTARVARSVWLALAAAGCIAAQAPNTLTPEEAEAGFKLLFNGRDLTGWSAPGGNWEVRDGAIAWLRSLRGQQLHYVAEEMPDEFELRFEWKVEAGSNSGVYYRPGQVEYQVLDNGGHTDGANRLTSAASLYYVAGPARDATRPVGQWNEGRIVCCCTVVQHWLNGVKVVEVDYSRPEWRQACRRLKERGGDLRARGGHLFLQDHTGRVWYRSIRIRSSCPTR
jgi:hypothetical protein